MDYEYFDDFDDSDNLRYFDDFDKFILNIVDFFFTIIAFFASL